MSTSFPGAIDTTNLTNPATTDKRNSPSLAGAQANQNDAIKAVETKVGTGATTPASATLLVGTGVGTSAWQGLTSAQLLAILSDETGTGSAVFATTPTIVTPKIDTINESTLGNGTTIGGVNIKSGALNTNSSVPTAALADNAVTSIKVAAGAIVQSVSSLTTTAATGTTIIPADDTIPQNTEGDQYMSLAITPKSTTNHLVIIASLQLASSGGAGTLVAALFQDATASAIAMGWASAGAAGAAQSIQFTHDMVSGTTSSTTFKVRAGNAATAGTTTFNGSGGGRLFGAITHSSLVILEYKA